MMPSATIAVVLITFPVISVGPSCGPRKISRVPVVFRANGFLQEMMSQAGICFPWSSKNETFSHINLHLLPAKILVLMRPQVYQD